MRPNEYNIELYAGESYGLQLPFTSNGEPVDMTGVEVTAQIKAKACELDVDESFHVDSDHAKDGVFILSLTPAQTEGLIHSCLGSDNTYVYDVRVKNNDVVFYALRGTITVMQSITRG